LKQNLSVEQRNCLLRIKAEEKLSASKAEKDFQAKLNKKDLELKSKEAEISKLQKEQSMALSKLKNEKDYEIQRLTNQLENLEDKKASELALALAEKDKTINQLQSDKEMALIKAQNQAEKKLREKEEEISKLKSDAEIAQNQAQLKEAQLITNHAEELKLKQEQIDYYKDLKTRMSTKMIGESLEIHCSTQFNQVLRPMLPNAYFEKDNEVIGGTKGDFIFRDSEDGIEYISIMFEMKNEMDITKTKHFNEDFFKKLDEDRRKKKCEFAVLVSMLEPDSELYNSGIVDVSYKYPKMYVIRPQFFIPLITLLVQTSKKSLEYKRELQIARSQSIDVTNFENSLLDFKDRFGRNYRLASEKFQTAIDEIDKSIDHLQKIKSNLLNSENNLRLANDKAQDLTIKKTDSE